MAASGVGGGKANLEVGEAMGCALQRGGGKVGFAVGFTDFGGGADHGGRGDGVDLLADGASEIVGETHANILILHERTAGPHVAALLGMTREGEKKQAFGWADRGAKRKVLRCAQDDKTFGSRRYIQFENENYVQETQDRVT